MKWCKTFRFNRLANAKIYTEKLNSHQFNDIYLSNVWYWRWYFKLDFIAFQTGLIDGNQGRIVMFGSAFKLIPKKWQVLWGSHIGMALWTIYSITDMKYEQTMLEVQHQINLFIFAHKLTALKPEWFFFTWTNQQNKSTEFRWKACATTNGEEKNPRRKWNL